MQDGIFVVRDDELIFANYASLKIFNIRDKGEVLNLKLQTLNNKEVSIQSLILNKITSGAFKYSKIDKG